jgi:hypothetical protein
VLGRAEAEEVALELRLGDLRRLPHLVQLQLVMLVEHTSTHHDTVSDEKEKQSAQKSILARLISPSSAESSTKRTCSYREAQGKAPVPKCTRALTLLKSMRMHIW